MARDYTPIPFEFLEEMDCLSDEEYGRLIRAAQAYSIRGEEPELIGTEHLFWKRVKNTINRFTDSFENRRTASQENGRKGGRPPKTEKQEEQICSEKNPENLVGFNGTQKTETETETQTETETETKIEANASCAETKIGSAQEPPVISMPLNDGTEFGVTKAMLDEFSSLYPAVDITQELRNMRGWLLNNPKNRKTRGGIRRFINAWLSKAQNRRPKAQFAQKKGGCESGVDRLARMYKEEFG